MQVKFDTAEVSSRNAVVSYSYARQTKDIQQTTNTRTYKLQKTEPLKNRKTEKMKNIQCSMVKNMKTDELLVDQIDLEGKGTLQDYGNEKIIAKCIQRYCNSAEFANLQARVISRTNMNLLEDKRADYIKWLVSTLTESFGHQLDEEAPFATLKKQLVKVIAGRKKSVMEIKIKNCCETSMKYIRQHLKVDSNAGSEISHLSNKRFIVCTNCIKDHVKCFVSNVANCQSHCDLKNKSRLVAEELCRATGYTKRFITQNALKDVSCNTIQRCGHYAYWNAYEVDSVRIDGKSFPSYLARIESALDESSDSDISMETSDATDPLPARSASARDESSDSDISMETSDAADPLPKPRINVALQHWGKPPNVKSATKSPRKENTAKESSTNSGQTFQYYREIYMSQLKKSETKSPRKENTAKESSTNSGQKGLIKKSSTCTNISAEFRKYYPPKKRLLNKWLDSVGQ